MAQLPVRLTAAGHEFAEALNRDDVWQVITTELKDASLETLSKTARSLLQAFVRKQVGRYLEF